MNNLVVMGLALLLSFSVQAEWHSAEDDIMGTRISIELWDENPDHAQQVMSEVMAEMRRIDNTLSTYKADSELTRLNQKAALAPVPVSAELWSLMKEAHRISVLTAGAFDITFASVGQFYDYREGKSASDQQIFDSLQAIDYQSIVYDETDQTVFFRHDGTKIDLGGIAKGYAVDQGIDIIENAGLVSAIVTAGGDSKILGNRGDRPWIVGIRNPRSENNQDYSVMIPLEDVALSTSGDYERFFMQGERRVHHIINPQTGRSASEVRSVSVLAGKGIESDALSTSVFVLGVAKGLELINKLEEIEAIIIDQQGKLHYSEGLLSAE